MLEFTVNAHDTYDIDRILGRHCISYAINSSGKYLIDKSDAYLFQNLLDENGIDYYLN